MLYTYPGATRAFFVYVLCFILFLLLLPRRIVPPPCGMHMILYLYFRCCHCHFFLLTANHPTSGGVLCPLLQTRRFASSFVFLLCLFCLVISQASLELEQERTRLLQQEAATLRHDLDASRATEAVVERQRQEHAKMAADSFGECQFVSCM